MGISAHFLQDRNQEKFYPYAHADATFDREGNKVGIILDNLKQSVQDIENDVIQSDWNETSASSMAYIKNKPTSLPANGGNADTVNGHTVNSNVPVDAKFTDTIYIHPESGVTAGTYKSVTVDEEGHITDGSNPTTLAGYGITDAASKAQGNRADTAVQSVKIGSSSTEYKNGTSVVLPAYPTTLPASDVSAWAKADTKPTYTASEVGADAAGSANSALSSAKSYTDTKIANLIGTADETMDTLGELADAIAENEDVVAALNSAIGNKVDKVSGKGLSTNDYTTTEKNKLSAIQSGAEVNQNAFSSVKVGTSTISADSKTDTLTLEAGANVTITPDTTSDKVTISAKNTVYEHPSYTPRETGLYKIVVDDEGHVSGASTVTKSDITALGIPAQDTNTWNAFKGASSSAAGTAGYVPAPSAGSANRYFRSDGTWAVPPDTNTTYSVMTGASSSTAGKSGLVPAPSAGSTNRFLSVDGTWKAAPTGLTLGETSSTAYRGDRGVIAYNHSQSAHAPSNAERNIIVGIQKNGSDLTPNSSTRKVNITVPTKVSELSNDAGYKTTDNNTTYELTKSGSTIKLVGSDGSETSVTDSNTTYSLSSFGITATATELNYADGVTSNIQTQLNGKLSTSGTAAAATKLATARAIDGVSFNGTAAIVHYGTCSTAAGTAAKTVSCTGFTLTTGARITVKFTVTNTASNPTLNVNSTGAKAIRYRGSAITAGYLAANRVYTFIYDGTYYELVGDINTDSNITYSAGAGISLSGTTFSNAGVRSISTGSSNGTISVNTGGSTANVAVKGLGSAAYTASSTYAASSHNHSASNITSGTLALARGGTGGSTAASARTNLGAVNLVCSSSEPSSQNTGDIWFKEID